MSLTILGTGTRNVNSLNAWLKEKAGLFHSNPRLLCIDENASFQALEGV